MKHKTKIYKKNIPLSMILSPLVFIMNAVNQGGTRERESGVGATPN